MSGVDDELPPPPPLLGRQRTEVKPKEHRSSLYSDELEAVQRNGLLSGANAERFVTTTYDYKEGTVHIAEDATESKTEAQGNQLLDLYLPIDSNGVPRHGVGLIIFIHGGLWCSGSKKEGARIGRHFAAHTSKPMAVASINYRLSTEQNQTDVSHPQHTEDVVQALQFLVSQQRQKYDQFPFDLSQVYGIGHSVGAHMLGLLTLNPTGTTNDLRFAGCVGLCSLFDQRLFYDDEPKWRSYIVRAMPPDTENSKDGWNCPMDYKDTSKCPKWLIVHSKKDPWVKMTQPRGFHQHLQSLSIETELIELEQGNHDEVLQWIANDGEQAKANDRTTTLIERFLGVST